VSPNVRRTSRPLDSSCPRTQGARRCFEEFFGAPDERLFLAAITGTNGKTTTSYLIDYILRAAGFKTSLVGTIGYHVAGRALPAVNTTPESLDLFRLLDQSLREGVTHFVFENSSHAQVLGRSYGLFVHTAIFTNLTRDHLDFPFDDGTVLRGEMPDVRARGCRTAARRCDQSR